MPSTNANAWGASAPGQPLAATTIQRREPGPRDVRIDVMFCGICHSDLHHCKGEWGEQRFPVVPGHEIAGLVSAVGAEVQVGRVGWEQVLRQRFQLLVFLAHPVSVPCPSLIPPATTRLPSGW